jgi:preprotein translocase subunit SecD
MLDGLPKKIIAGSIGLLLVFVLMAAFYPVMVEAGDDLKFYNVITV